MIRNVTGVMFTTFLALGILALVLGQVSSPWYLELFSHFKLQYTLLFIGLFVAFLCLKQNGRAILSLLFALICLSAIAPYIPATKYTEASESSSASLRLMFYNMWVGNTKYDAIAQMVKTEDPDVLILAEVAGIAYKSLKERLSADYPYSDFQTGPTTYLDVAFFSKKEPTFVKVVYSKKDRIPVLRIGFNSGEKDFVVYGVHTSAPLSSDKARSRDEQLMDLVQNIKDEVKPTIMLGDLNITPWSPVFKRFISDSGLVEARLGRGLMQSWSLGLPAISRIPIDHALSTEGIDVVGMRIGDSVGSDHSPVIVDAVI